MFEDLNTLELVSKVTEFNEASEFMKDENLDEALALIVKLMVKPDISPKVALPLIIKLQAISAKMAILATHYTVMDKGPSGSEQAKKKNLYYTMREALDKLVDSLKITVRYSG